MRVEEKDHGERVFRKTMNAVDLAHQRKLGACIAV